MMGYRSDVRRPDPHRLEARVWRVGLMAVPVLLTISVAALLLAGGCASDRDAGGQAAGKTQMYHCPMHPTFISDNPKATCPICGMNVVPIPAETGGGGAAAGESAQPGGVPGMAPVGLTAEGIRLAGVQTAPAVRDTVVPVVRTVGSVVPDETRIRHVQVKVSGWVEKLLVNTTGQVVHAGTPILAIYSPELLAGEEEYLHTREAAANLPATAAPETRERIDGLVRAARSRLLLLDAPESLLDRLDQGGPAERAVTLVAPISGTVTTKDVFEGQSVEPGMELFAVTDLARIWIEADLYEYEAHWARLGQRATVTLPYDPSARFEGEIRFIYPVLDPQTRTVKVRFEFPNQDQAFKPGMFANVELRPDAVEGLFVPEDAVMDTGVRQIVFVDGGGGQFTPRDVEVGLRSGGRVQVLSGLMEGEAVAIRANFLLDSESKIRASIAGASAPAMNMPGMDMPKSSMPGMNMPK
jgi:membrane fusion protein, copper/silver efflux system